MRNIFTASLLLFLSISAIALPQCDQEPFDNCIATAASADGSKYVGEWMDGKPHGEGALIKAHQLDANETTNPEPQYEEQDMTTSSQELACAAGGCDII